MAGGNLIKYPKDIITPTSDIKTIKTHCNSIVYK